MANGHTLQTLIISLRRELKRLLFSWTDIPGKQRWRGDKEDRPGGRKKRAALGFATDALNKHIQIQFGGMFKFISKWLQDQMSIPDDTKLAFVDSESEVDLHTASSAPS
jgi:hypothetical protein